MERFVCGSCRPIPWQSTANIRCLDQSRTVETTQAELMEDTGPNLPPLMNPTMLEASEDLTNLSHLNEPAGLSALYDTGLGLC